MTTKRCRVTTLILILVILGGCSSRPSEPPTQAPGARAEAGPTVAPVQAPTAVPTVLAPTAASAATAEPAAPTEAPEGVPGLADLTTLAGLPIDRFFDESWKLLMLRDPEWVTTEGLVQRFATGNDRLTDLSDAYTRETQQMQAAVLALLRQYDRATLTPEQQISFDVYEWYLDDLVRSQEFTYYDYPVNPIVTGLQNQLLQFFNDVHPITSKKDAEDYIARLSQMGAKFGGLIEGLELRRQAGVVIPRFLFPWFLGDIQGIAHARPQSTPFYATLKDKLSAVPGLESGEREALLQAAEEAIAASVIPAYAALEQALGDLQQAAPAAIGAGQLPDGAAYYSYALRHHTTTDLTADQIHELGLKELERIHGEMRAVFDQLGYPKDAGLTDLLQRAAQEAGYLPGNQAAAEYERIVRDAEGKLDAAFDLRPKADVVVIAGALGDYYASAALDGSRPGAFFARVTGPKERYAMRTVAYHEMVPGHHFQIALAQESDLPLFRNVVVFTGFAEGWALYAEHLAYELGWYADDPYGNLGRLRDQAFRAARLVVDTGIHSKGWSFDQAHRFMVENVGREADMLQYEVGRYVVWPGQATSYMVGMLKIMELRQRAMDSLGDRFDLKEFHRVLLSNGSMPLAVLEKVVDRYIGSKLQQ